MEFDNQPSARALTRMQEETGSLLAPAGVIASFHALPLRTPLTRSHANVMLIRFKGACDIGGVEAQPDDMAPFGPSTLRLAATRTRGSAVLPFAEVECDAVRLIANSVPVRDRAQAMGQALGRVVAHELYHLLWQRQHHADEGLAKAVLSWKELLHATFDLESLSAKAAAP
ncbi:MAG: hypothetical protein JNK87_24315 [Bryobacterales bacterium]|nr:hypothetical protein [Bryobacterales bacterium]